MLHPAHPLRIYLRLPLTQAILWCFLGISILLVAIPGIDLRVSRLFYDGGFYMANMAWTRLLHASVTWFVVGSLAAVAGVYAFNRLTGRTLLRIDGLKVAYLLLVLALGAGLVVNGLLKEGFGRARPKDIVEFGGSSHFTPAYEISSNCGHNCSFSSGDSAGAFFALAFIVAVSRRRAVVTSAVGFGVLVSIARIASGSHFLSDTVVSFFIMLIVSDALHYRMFVFGSEPAEIVLPPLLEPVAYRDAALVTVVEEP